MTEQRERIQAYVATHPGQHFSALARALDLAPGQAQHHLKTLLRRERVIEERLYGRTHYYTPEYDPRERRKIAVLRRETARDVLFYLLESGPSGPNQVAESLEVARSTLEWHLDHLVEQDLIEKRRNGTVTLEVTDETETVRLLKEITPSLSDRMLDRFTRLVDDLFSPE